MNEYVKRPIPIHAFRWNGNVKTLVKNVPRKDIKKYFDEKFCISVPPRHNTLIIKSLEGDEECPYGDYVIRGINGEYYPCDPKIFKESYKKVR